MENVVVDLDAVKKKLIEDALEQVRILSLPDLGKREIAEAAEAIMANQRRMKVLQQVQRDLEPMEFVKRVKK